MVIAVLSLAVRSLSKRRYSKSHRRWQLSSAVHQKKFDNYLMQSIRSAFVHLLPYILVVELS